MNQSMSAPEPFGNSTGPTLFESLYWPVALALAAMLLLLWFLGYGPGGSACGVAAMPMASNAVLAAPAAAATPVVVAAPVTATVVRSAPTTDVPPAARLYFDTDSAQVKLESKGSLHDVVAYLNATATARANVSGFHDPSGHVKHNLKLAHRRASTVKALLITMGVAPERINLVKPTVVGPGGTLSEARRVEVSIAVP